MTMVNMFEAKTDLSKLVKKLENKEEDLIVICRSGKPVAHLTLPPKKPRFASREFLDEIGVSGLDIPSMTQEEFDAQNDEIAELFGL